MHEWALAEGIISTAIKVAKKENLKKIAKIKVTLGELQQIDTEIFNFALKELTKPQSPLLNKTKIELKPEKAVLGCRVCGHKWAFSEEIEKLSEKDSESIHFIPDIAHTYLRCPKCKSPDFEIIKGRGVWIDSIEGV
ncbi:hydrogenase nickel incorporation protein HypA [candidate division WOR-3 bacterium]|nr:hydrogenase nickel incorporation protein HypA [candidate division WOR-3 bacterium]